jgi:hypothetical protein
VVTSLLLSAWRSRKSNSLSDPLRLSDQEREIFDELCDEVIAWSKVYYGATLVSYVILMELVKSGWSKNRFGAEQGIPKAD